MPRRCSRRLSRTSPGRARHGSAAARRARRAPPPAGPLDDAAALLEQAGPVRTELCRAGLALGEGDASHAIELLERLLRQHRRRAPLDRAPRSSSSSAHGRARRARGGGRGARGSPRGRTGGRDPALHAAPTSLPACSPRRGRARACSAPARGRTRPVRGVRRPFEAAQARIALATSLAAAGRPEAARREATAAPPAARARRGRRRRARAARLQGPSRGPACRSPRSAPRAGDARPACRGAHEPADRGTARHQRAHRAPARDEHPPQARRAVATRCRHRRAASVADHASPAMPTRPPKMAVLAKTWLAATYGRAMRDRPPTRPRRGGRAGADRRAGRTHGDSGSSRHRRRPEGDRPRDVGARRLPPLRKQTVWDVGPVLVAACGVGAGACSTSRPAAGTWRSARPGRAPRSSPPTSRRRSSTPVAARRAPSASSSSGWRPMRRPFPSPTQASTS